MFHNTNFFTTNLHIILQEKSEAFQNAAVLLGGQAWLCRTQRLILELGSGSALTRRLRHETIALHELLTLQNVDNLDSYEPAHFALLEPEEPHVEEICLLADELHDAMFTSGFIFNTYHTYDRSVTGFWDVDRGDQV